MEKNYYSILGLTKEATQSDIKKAYRNLSKIHHPDKGGDADKFKEISEAYETLSDVNKREKYDNPPRNNFSSFYTQQSYIKKGNNIRINIKLTLEEIYSGTTKTFKFNRNIKCTNCDGRGGFNIKTCTTCDGSGAVLQRIDTPIGTRIFQRVCPDCMGEGQSVGEDCKVCIGEGVSSSLVSEEFIIPHSVYDNMTFVNKNKGHAIKGGENGDLHIVISEIPHETYGRFNDKLQMKLSLSYPDLVLGCSAEIKTIDGSRIKIKIPEYSNVGNNLKVQGKGLKEYGSEERGDLYITLYVIIPKTIDEKTREHLIKLNKLLK